MKKIKKNPSGPAEFKDNMESWAVAIMVIVAKGVKKINKMHSLKTKHKAKVDVISSIIKNLPIGRQVCIYCKTYVDCKNCPYGKSHDCATIADGQKDFLKWIKDYYA